MLNEAATGHDAQETRMQSHHRLTLIAACNACADACDHCAATCLHEPDLPHLAHCIAMDMDCAAICRVTAACLSRQTPFARALTAACSLACEACALACERHSHEHCQRCAEACRQCANECHQLAA